MRQQIIQNVGGRVFVDLPRRATSATVTIKTGANGDLYGASVVAATATVDTATATVSDGNDAVIGDKALTAAELVFGSMFAPGQPVVLAPDGIDGIGAHYLNSVAWLEVTTAGSGEVTPIGNLYLRQPLRFAMAEDSVVQSRRVYFDVIGARVPYIAENYRAVFDALIDGATVRREVIFDVGLRTSDNPATVDDLLAEWPDVPNSEHLEWQGEFGFPSIETGWREVYQNIQGFGRNPNRIRDTERLIPLIVNRAQRKLAKFGTLPPAWADSAGDFIALCDADYTRLFNEAMGGLQWYDNTDDAVVNDADTETIRRVRFTR